MRSRTEKYSSIILIINSTFLITSHNDILIIKEGVSKCMPSFFYDKASTFPSRGFVMS